MELLRDRSAEFEEANVRAVGISRDSPWSHVAWMQALDLNFPLLSDWNAEDGRAPWLDPYTFRPESSPRVNFGGWPFGLPYWPLSAAFGQVVAWNVLILLTYLAAGGFACLWLRELGLPLGAALVGGLVFEL